MTNNEILSQFEEIVRKALEKANFVVFINDYREGDKYYFILGKYIIHIFLCWECGRVMVVELEGKVLMDKDVENVEKYDAFMEDLLDEYALAYFYGEELDGYDVLFYKKS